MSLFRWIVPAMCVAYARGQTSAPASNEALPSNQRLAACMPDTIDSILIMRRAGLCLPNSDWRNEMGTLFGEPMIIPDDPNNPRQPGDRGPEDDDDAKTDLVFSGDEKGLDRVVVKDLFDLGPEIRVLGGSDFKPPEGVGMGDCTYMSMWITQRPTTKLQERLGQQSDSAKSIRREEMRGVAVYSSDTDVPSRRNLLRQPEIFRKTVFVAFPTSRLTVITWSRDHMRSTLAKWSEQVDGIPERWRSVAAKVEVDAPLLILRQMKPESQDIMVLNFDDPEKTEGRKVRLSRYAISGGGDKLRVRVRCETDAPKIAVNYFYSQTFTAGFCPPVWKWHRTDDKDGFSGTAEYDPDSKQYPHPSLVIMTLFGFMMAI